MSILTITLAYIFGIKWGLYQELKFLILVLIFLSISTHIFFENKKNIISFLCIVCFIGAIYSRQKLDYMQHKYDEGEIKTSITILTHEEVSSDGYYYKYKVKNDSKDKFILYLKLKPENIYKIGDKLNIVGGFKMPETARNKGGFDYRMYLYSNNIYGTIKAKKVEVVSLTSENLVYVVQNKIRENMLKIFSKETAGILNGMLIGETNDISFKIKENFQKIGITHLLAVSRCKRYACN